MMAWQLFVPLVALLTLDGAQSQGNLKCAYKGQKNFCRPVIRAYQFNEEAIQHLKKVRPGDIATLLQANQLLLTALNKTEESELDISLTKPLYLEVLELTQLKNGCRFTQYECVVAFFAVFQAIVKLAEAIMEVTTGTDVKAAYDQYRDGLFRGNQTLADLGIKLGTSIMEAFWKVTP